MSDIPVGSPPAPPGRHAAPGGWYADPVDPTQERYWDGWQWSRTTRPAEAVQPTLQRPYGTAPQGRYAGPPAPGGYAFPAEPATGRAQAARTADGVTLAGWWWRVLATVVDTLITSAVITALGFPLYRSMIEALSAYFNAAVEAGSTGAPPPPSPTPGELISSGNQALLVALTLAVGLAYQMIFLRWKSATPGKIICGLRVVPVDQGRRAGPLGWNSIAVRAAVWVLPGLHVLLAIFQLVDVLFPLFQRKRQALHDLAARTQVVRGR